MKLKLALICLAITLASLTKAQTVTSTPLIGKAKQKIQAYIKLKEPGAPTYKPLAWAPLSKIDQPATNGILVKTSNQLLNAKIDTLAILQKAFPGPTVAYSQIHVFTVEESGNIIQKVYSFYLDKNLEIVNVTKVRHKNKSKNKKDYGRCG